MRSARSWQVRLTSCPSFLMMRSTQRDRCHMMFVATKSKQPRFMSSIMAMLILAFAVVAGCSDNPVGRVCELGGATEATQRVVASPSLDCVSRQCLRVPQEVVKLPEGSRLPPSNQGLCTSECGSDADCDRVPESPCKTGFTCGIAVTVGPFCCKKFCICKDYIVIPATGKLAAPEACNAANPDAACCNLDGRRGNATYPNCK
jgi:hypothetical protein